MHVFGVAKFCKLHWPLSRGSAGQVSVTVLSLRCCTNDLPIVPDEHVCNVLHSWMDSSCIFLVQWNFASCMGHCPQLWFPTYFYMFLYPIFSNLVYFGIGLKRLSPMWGSPCVQQKSSATCRSNKCWRTPLGGHPPSQTLKLMRVRKTKARKRRVTPMRMASWQGY